MLVTDDDKLNDLLTIAYPRCEVGETLRGGFCELFGKVGFEGLVLCERHARLRSTGIVRAEIGKRALDNSQPGTLRVDLVAGGQVVREQDSSSATAVVTVTYDAQEAREEL